MSNISLSNVSIKILSTNVDNMNQNINFNLQSTINPILSTNVYGSAALHECLQLSQSEIVDLIWSRASYQCVNWLQFVSRPDINLASLNGSVFSPSNNYVTLNFGASNLPMTSSYVPPRV